MVTSVQWQFSGERSPAIRPQQNREGNRIATSFMITPKAEDQDLIRINEKLAASKWNQNSEEQERTQRDRQSSEPREKSMSGSQKQGQEQVDDMKTAVNPMKGASISLHSNSANIYAQHRADVRQQKASTRMQMNSRKPAEGKNATIFS